MAELSIRGLIKDYPGGMRVLSGLDLDVRSGEFFTLLGPSGCGKTTLLRSIAGFIAPNAGTIDVGGERLNDKPAHKRDIGMVFQDYAVFPHLNVADNVGFGLKARKMPREAIAARVAETLKVVHLEGYERRLPSELSGGQQQRVGLARALAIRPKLLLMDEPLSNLDAKLRIELREDIRDIQRRLGITTIYVTHDQEEALAVSDRICVMNAGRIEQLGEPFEIYTKPATRFAAGFVGAMNFLDARIEGGRLLVGDESVALAPGASAGTVAIAIRPEHVDVSSSGSAAADGRSIALRGKVLKTTFLGREAHISVETDAGAIAAERLDPAPGDLAMTGAEARVRLPCDRLHVFDKDGAALKLTFGS